MWLENTKILIKISHIYDIYTEKVCKRDICFTEFNFFTFKYNESYEKIVTSRFRENFKDRIFWEPILKQLKYLKQLKNESLFWMQRFCFFDEFEAV